MMMMISTTKHIKQIKNKNQMAAAMSPSGGSVPNVHPDPLPAELWMHISSFVVISPAGEMNRWVGRGGVGGLVVHVDRLFDVRGRGVCMCGVHACTGVCACAASHST